MRIVVGITGGIAAFKVASLIRELTEAGNEVKVVATSNALKFIGQPTLEALSKNKVHSDLFSDVNEVTHIALAKWAEKIVIAPATAAFIARYANGLADDLLLNVLLASKCSVYIAPAMHTEMWMHPSTTKNIDILRSRNVSIIGPDSGRLTGQDTGEGRMAEPAAIANAVMAQSIASDLAGKRILITAGGTQEPIDAVRYIGNRSSGKQGIALGLAAQSRGATVTFVECNINQDLPFSNVIRVSTASELQTAIESNYRDQDALIMAAAVADYRMQTVDPGKLKKSKIGAHLHLELEQTPDILSAIATARNQENPKLVVVGFAAEAVSDEREMASIATAKMTAKGCDLLVANDVTGGAVFESNFNEVQILDRHGKSMSCAGDKRVVANAILDALVDAFIDAKDRISQ